MKPRIVNVKITSSENNELDANRPVFDSLEAADRALLSVAVRKRNGGYDKTRFVLTFDDGETYEGRLDLTRDNYSIRSHVRNWLTFLAGRAYPVHITQEQYDAFLARQAPGVVDNAGKWLDEREWN